MALLFFGIIFIFTLIFVADIDAALEFGRRGFRKSYRISPLLASKTVGIIIIACIMLIQNKKGYFLRILCLLASLLSAYVLIVSASRGAIIFLYFNNDCLFFNTAQ